MRLPAEGPDRASARSGFTLIELLVTMVIGGIIATVILQLIQGQSRFVQTQNAQQEVQQNARGTLDLLTSDLRAVPTGMITLAERNKITFRSPRVWGVTCGPVLGSDDRAWISFPAGTFPADFPANPAASPDWGLVLEYRDTVTGARSWVLAQIDSVQRVSASRQPNCETDPAALQSADLRRVWYRHSSSLLNSPVFLGGTRVFIYQNLTYEVAPDAASPNELWVKRSHGSTGLQPVAGPLGPEGRANTDGLVFSYCKDNWLSTPPGTSADSISAIKLRVTMQSHGRNRERRQADTDSTLVFLRNTPGGTSCDF